jgi:hypothetical protein
MLSQVLFEAGDRVGGRVGGWEEGWVGGRKGGWVGGRVGGWEDERVKTRLFFMIFNCIFFSTCSETAERVSSRLVSLFPLIV